MQVLIIWDRMGDYHRSRVNAYREMYPNDILYTADLGTADKLYKWKNTEHCNHFVLSEKEAEQNDVWHRFKNFKALIKIHNINKVVLSGYGRTEYLLFTFWLKQKGLDTYMFAESWYEGNGFIDAIKGLFLKCFVKGVFTSGANAEKHFTTRLKYPKYRISIGYSVVDNAHFHYERSLEAVKQAINNKPTLLCVARYAEEKNLALLIAAFEASKLASKWQLQLVGGGPLKVTLEGSVSNPDVVRLLNWQAYSDLPLLYQNASCFILPSQFEPWGLVVNEAMSASLPIILSESCGCFPDLLLDNGFGFEATNKNELIAVLNQLHDNSAEDLHTMGQKSNKIIRNYSPITWAKSLNKLIS
jgi:1,2-diacylglycerol 3-alpha-glucosyltransferase